MGKHAAYVRRVSAEKDTMMYAVTDHLRMSGVYWGLCAMEVMASADKMDKDDIVAWVKRCYHADCGGYGGNEGHDPHMLYTLSAVQLMALCDRLDEVDADKCVAAPRRVPQPTLCLTCTRICLPGHACSHAQGGVLRSRPAAIRRQLCRRQVG